MEVSPQEIVFHAPLNRASVSILKLHNTTDQVQIYKIKTTAPQLYCVKPNASSIKPGEELDIHITRQPRSPKAGEECRDKFLVLSTNIDESELTQKVADIWTSLEKKAKEDTSNKTNIQSQKLRVSYDLSSENADIDNDAHIAPAPPSASASTSLPSSAANTAVSTANNTAVQSPKQAPMSPTATAPTTPAVTKSSSAEPVDTTTNSHNESTKPVSSGSAVSAVSAASDTPAAVPTSSHHETTTSSSSSAKSAQSGTNHSNSSNPEIDANTPLSELGVPPKSRQIDTGDAKTGPKLDNKDIPEGDGPKPEHDVSPDFEKEEEEKQKKAAKEAASGKYTEKDATQGKHTHNDVSGTEGKHTHHDVSGTQGKYDEKSVSGTQGKHTHNDVSGTQGKHTHNDVSGTQGKHTHNDVSGTQGKYDEKSVDGSAGKFTQRNVQEPVDQQPQEVSVTLTFVLVVVAFFIGWRFF